MRHRELSRQLQRLESLLERTPQASSDDLELQAHWGRYLCVLVAGFLENALTEIYSEFAYRTASRPVAGYASSELARIQNPKASRFLATAGAFNPAWAADLDAFLAADGRREAIDGIMNVRHQVAHGENAGIGVAQVSQYLQKIVAVVDFIESQCS